ncbi:hypothetical protein AALP_AA7G087800 [Arabis alpina]|uniref:Alpha-galactosidase n=1 Tax=Arabis alpina TaxID=50452 RepID=A0A087GGU0_ARAAL|nr:hypothetical protein AALP_AA7G087800 [Arabis alpina]
MQHRTTKLFRWRFRFGIDRPLRIFSSSLSISLLSQVESSRSVKRVSDVEGDDSEIFRRHLFVNGLDVTPPMGWNSWNHFTCNIDEKVIKETGEFFNLGLRNSYILLSFVYLLRIANLICLKQLMLWLPLAFISSVTTMLTSVFIVLHNILKSLFVPHMIVGLRLLVTTREVLCQRSQLSLLVLNKDSIHVGIENSQSF